MGQLKQSLGDVDWRHGRGWSLVYFGGDEHAEFLKAVYGLFFAENGLSASAFPTLRKFESEVIAMMRDLLRGDDEVGGTMTSGGTESILLAMKTYRDQARSQQPEIRQPEILLPESAHPAFLKAAQYFDLKTIAVPLDAGCRSDLDALSGLITGSTICIVASAPCYPHGVVDHIPEIAAIARRAGVGLHVDACLGGFLLPFMRELGTGVTDFDFAVPGVTSISADLHKNGYAAKGASAVLYRGAALRRHQYFVSADWPGGLYASPTMLGTRPGGAIAAAWAAMVSLGREGYRELTRQTLAVTAKLTEEISAIPELSVLGRPEVNVVRAGSDTLDIFAVADEMEKQGWRMDRQSGPDCLHHIVTPNHAQAVDAYVRDLRQAAIRVKSKPPGQHVGARPALYGVTGQIIAGSDADALMRDGLDQLYNPKT